MNRDDLLLMAFEAKLFNLVEDCPNCAIRIPNMEGLERFAFIFFQAARQEMIKQGWRHCAEGQKITQYCGLTEQAIRAEREECAKICDSRNLPHCAALVRARNGLETDTE